MGFFARGNRNLAADAMAQTGPGAHPRISIKGNHFALVDASGARYPWPMLILPVVIIGANPKTSKLYYPGKYDPESTEPPLCFSDNGIAASSLAAEPQARTCVECPHFGWGSATSEMTGKKTKACNDRKKLAVVVPGDDTRLVYELQIPPTSLKNLNTYSSLISSMSIPDRSRKADLPDVITLVSFAPDAVGQLEFKQWAWCDSIDLAGRLCYDGNGNPISAPDGGDAFGAFLEDLWEGDTVDKIVNLEDRPWHGAGAIGAAPQPAQVSYEPQPHGGALQRGSAPAISSGPPAGQPATPFTPPAGAQPQQPITVTQPKSTRGGARAGAGRKPQNQPVQPAAPAAAPFNPAGAQPAAPAAAPFNPAAATTAAPSAAAPPGAAPRTDDGLGIPAFLNRTGNGAAPMQEAAAPPAPVSAALDKAFGLRT